mmetsp:Transcript_27597/g.31774  ORF Transcript_27597/g.31774 Transcript_27597/m.31774 type:complete len:97 (-) Transcript_27597:277-567(-)
MNSEIETILQDESLIKEIVEEAFRLVDEDGSGSIDIMEFKKVIEDTAKELNLDFPEESEIVEVMHELDCNQDGTISLDEFETLIKLILDAMKPKKN